MAPELDLDSFVSMAIKLRSCLDQAWHRLMEMPPTYLGAMCTRTRASLLHDLWTEIVEAEFANDPYARFIKERGLKQLVNDSVRVRFKKINRRLLVAGNRTGQSQSWVQMPIPGITPLLSLNFGYRPDSLWSRIETAGLSIQVDKKVPWFLEVLSPSDTDGFADDIMPSPIGDSPVRVKRHVLEQRQDELFRGTGDGQVSSEK